MRVERDHGALLAGGPRRLATTPVDLYRNGNGTGPRMDHVRTNLINPHSYDMVAPHTGGISSADRAISTWRSVWKLPAGTNIPMQLHLSNDDPSQGHWTWEPSFPIQLMDYVKALSMLNGSFTRVQ
jgi:hypothetical protein